MLNQDAVKRGQNHAFVLRLIWTACGMWALVQLFQHFGVI